LPVPDGFHVTTAAYQQFVAQNDLQSHILAALASVDVSQPTTLEAASRAIYDLFAYAPMPQEIARAIERGYADLCNSPFAIRNLPIPVAVRSSATAEDLPDLSFAGQQETFLNIQGAVAVQDAVKRCWASLWTPRAIGYRAQHQIAHDAVVLAVVVQTLVLADAAGILFTANPVNGRRDQIVINAAWGLGEAIVGGLVTPDTLIVDKASGRVIERDIAEKTMMTVRVDGGTEDQPVPETLRRAVVLKDDQVAELGRLGSLIEQLYKMPMDIEWTLAQNEFAIVQARPITALPEASSAIE
jgi:phosphoenolpyruvate synthase/pyruvate phosphate dikinase